MSGVSGYVKIHVTDDKAWDSIKSVDFSKYGLDKECVNRFSFFSGTGKYVSDWTVKKAESLFVLLAEKLKGKALVLVDVYSESAYLYLGGIDDKTGEPIVFEKRGGGRSGNSELLQWIIRKKIKPEYCSEEILRYLGVEKIGYVPEGERYIPDEYKKYFSTAKELEGFDINGRRIVPTGDFYFDREEMESFVTKRGGIITNKVTGNTALLVIGLEDRYAEDSKKLENAVDQKKKGKPVTILSDIEFMKWRYSIDAAPKETKKVKMTLSSKAKATTSSTTTTEEQKTEEKKKIVRRKSNKIPLPYNENVTIYESIAGANTELLLSMTDKKRNPVAKIVDSYCVYSKQGIGFDLKVENFFKDARDGEEEKNFPNQDIIKEYTVFRDALEFSEVFAVSKAQFDPHNDRESEIRNGIIRSAQDLYTTMRFLKMVYSYAGRRRKSISEAVTPEVYYAILSYLSQIKNTQWGEDWFGLGRIIKWSYLFGRSSTMFPIESYSDTHEELEESLPIMKFLHDELLEAKKQGIEPSGIAANILATWCTLAIAAKYKFKIVEGGESYDLQQPKHFDYYTLPTIKDEIYRNAEIKDGWKIYNGVALGYEGNRTDVTVPDNIKDFCNCSMIDDGAIEILRLSPQMEDVNLSGAFEIDDYNHTIKKDNLKHTIQKIYVAEGTKSIGAYSFVGFKNVREIYLPKTVEYIAEGAFKGLEKLEIVDITEDSKLRIIYDSAFEDCKSLKEIKLPKELEYIRSSAFKGCIGFKSIEFPHTLISIDAYALKDCPYLGSVVIPNPSTHIDMALFDHGISYGKVIKAPVGSNAETFAKHNLLTFVPYEQEVTYKDEVEENEISDMFMNNFNKLLDGK